MEGTGRNRRLKEVKVYEIDVPEEREEARVAEVAQQLLQQVHSGGVAIPMLPTSASEVMALANDPNAAVRDIERVVKRDPLLAARVLAVANSSVYGGGKVGSLGNALSRLGSGAIRDVLFQAVAQSHIFRGSASKALAAELEHGVAVAHIATLICKQLGIPKGHAFVCGLLHDLGRPIIFDLLNQMRAELTPAQRDLVATKGHAVIGGHVAKRWELPALVGEVCRHHHRYRDDKTGRYSQLGNIIAVADRIAEHLAIGRRQRLIDFTRDRCFFDVGLDPGSAMAIVAAAQGMGVAA